MKRAIRRFVSTLQGPRKWMFFIVLALVCIVSICMGIYTQFFYKYSDTDPLMLGINIGSKKTAEEIDILKAEFNDLFNNSILINSENVRVDRIEPAKELVYAGYNLVNEDVKQLKQLDLFPKSEDKVIELDEDLEIDLD